MREWERCDRLLRIATVPPPWSLTVWEWPVAPVAFFLWPHLTWFQIFPFPATHLLFLSLIAGRVLIRQAHCRPFAVPPSLSLSVSFCISIGFYLVQQLLYVYVVLSLLPLFWDRSTPLSSIASPPPNRISCNSILLGTSIPLSHSISNNKHYVRDIVKNSMPIPLHIHQLHTCHTVTEFWAAHAVGDVLNLLGQM